MNSIESALTTGQVVELTRQILQSSRQEREKAEIILRLYSLLSRARLKITRTLLPGQFFQTDMAIVGAGIQGLQLAYALAMAGKDFVLLEESGFWAGGFLNYTAATGMSVLLSGGEVSLEPIGAPHRPTLQQDWESWLESAPLEVGQFLLEAEWPGRTPPKAPLVALWEQLVRQVQLYRLKERSYKFKALDICLLEDPSGMVKIMGQDNTQILARRVALSTGPGELSYQSGYLPGFTPLQTGLPTNKVLPLLSRDPWQPEHQIKSGERVLIIGSGDSAGNWANVLAVEGVAGKVFMSSRRDIRPLSMIPSRRSLSIEEFRNLSLSERVDSSIIVQAGIHIDIYQRTQKALENGRLELLEYTGELIKLEANLEKKSILAHFEKIPQLECDRVFFATGFAMPEPTTFYSNFPALYKLVQSGKLKTFEGFAVRDSEEVFWAGSNQRLIPIGRAAMLWLEEGDLSTATIMADNVKYIT